MASGVEEELEEAKALLREREASQNLLNENLLTLLLKDLVGREVYGLLQPKYDKVSGTECTDEIAIDLVNHIQSIKEAFLFKCQRLEDDCREEREKHMRYKNQVIALKDDLRVSQEEIEELLNSLSAKVNQENELKKTLDDKRQLIHELNSTIFELQLQATDEDEELSEPKGRIVE